MIKILVMDVDGTLTDGCIHIGNDGELFKSFYCRDGLGIIQAKKKGIISVVITSRESDIVKKRCSELGISDIIQASTDKLADFEYILSKYGIAYEEAAYIADDVNDLAAITKAGIRGCPCDAVIEIKEICNFISSYRGGRGAVREFCDYIISLNDIE